MNSHRARCLTLTLVLLACLVVCPVGGAQDAPSPANSGSAPQSASVVIVVDTSADAKSAAKALKKAATNFAEKFSSNDELALFASQDKPVLVQGFTSDISLLNKSVDTLRPSGKLAAYESVAQAVDYARSDAVNDKQAIVAFIDELDGSDTKAIESLQNTIRQGQRVPLY